MEPGTVIVNGRKRYAAKSDDGVVAYRWRGGLTTATPSIAQTFEPRTIVVNRRLEPAERVVFTNKDGVRIGEAIRTPSGVMVWGRDLGYDDDDNLTSLDMADDFDRAARKIADHEQHHA